MRFKSKRGFLKSKRGFTAESMILTIFRIKGLLYHIVVTGLLGIVAFYLKGKNASLSMIAGSTLIGLNFLFFPIIWDFYFIKKYKFFAALFFILKYLCLALSFYLFWWVVSDIHIIAFSIGLLSVLLTWVLILIF